MTSQDLLKLPTLKETEFDVTKFNHNLIVAVANDAPENDPLQNLRRVTPNQLLRLAGLNIHDGSIEVHCPDGNIRTILLTSNTIVA